MLLNRLAIKDFKLGKFKIAKGTRFNVFVDTIHHSDLHYDNPFRFEFDRFTMKQQSSNSSMAAPCYLPFSLGKRNCIGRYLGELMIQLILVNITKFFELKSLENHELSALFGPSYGPENCFVKIKSKTVI